MSHYLDRLFFPGSKIVFPILALFCLMIYYSWTPYAYDSQGQMIYWRGWYAIAIVSALLGSLWGYEIRLWDKKFIFQVICVFLLSFSMLECTIYRFGANSVPLISIEIIISCFCIYKGWYSRKQRFLALFWLLPLVLIFIYNLLHSIFCIIFTSIILLIIISMMTILRKKHFGLICGIIVFYGLCLWIYCPVNPLLLFKNIESVAVSSRSTSLITEKDDRYNIINGKSGKSLTDVSFDCWTEIRPYVGGFVGFTPRMAWAESCSTLKDLPGNMFPIMVSDSNVYVSSQIDIYKGLDKLSKSENQVDKLTSQIFFDYLKFFQTPDSATVTGLTKDYRALLRELTALSTDSVLLLGDDKVETTLRNLSRNMSLGMLNALSLDLISNKEYKTALKIYSFQFFFTFYAESFFQHINTNLNINVTREYGNTSHHFSKRITDSDLKQANSFEQWVNIFSMARAIAERYLSEQKYATAKNVTEILSAVNDSTKISSYNDIYNKQRTLDLQRQIKELYDLLSEYKTTPTLKQYITGLQNFLYNCIERNYIPDYNAFFLNRFNEITPMVPLNPKSVSAYNNLSQLYSLRFKQNVEDIEELRSQYNSFYSQLSQRADMQDQIQQKLNELGLEDSMTELLKEILYKQASATNKESHKESH